MLKIQRGGDDGVLFILTDESLMSHTKKSSQGFTPKEILTVERDPAEKTHLGSCTVCHRCFDVSHFN